MKTVRGIKGKNHDCTKPTLFLLFCLRLRAMIRRRESLIRIPLDQQHWCRLFEMGTIQLWNRSDQQFHNWIVPIIDSFIQHQSAVKTNEKDIGSTGLYLWIVECGRTIQKVEGCCLNWTSWCSSCTRALTRPTQPSILVKPAWWSLWLVVGRKSCSSLSNLKVTSVFD